MPLIRNTGKMPKGAERSASASLTDSSADVRFRAAREAAGNPDQISALSVALSREDNPRVREALFSALANIAMPESTAAVVSYLRSDDANLRMSAMDALRASPGSVASHLDELLLDPDSDVRLLACDLARSIDRAEATRLLCRLLDNESHPNVCAMAVEVLSEIGDASAIGPLARCAARFPDDPFLPFAIEVVSDRLNQRRPSLG